MNIVINISNEDLLKNPAIVEAITALTEKCAYGHKVNTKVESPTKEHKETEESPTIEAETTVEVNQNQYTIEEVRKAFANLAKAKGSAAAKNILTALGAAKVTELPKEAYGEALKKIREAQ